MGEKNPVGGDAASLASGNGPETLAAWRQNHGSSHRVAREERRRVAQLVLADLRLLSDRRAGPALRETKSPEGILSVMSTALVTGGCGFVGRHLTNRLLASGADVWIIDNLSTGQHPDHWLECIAGRQEIAGQGTRYLLPRGTVTFLHEDALATMLGQLGILGNESAPRFPDFDR